MVDRITTTVIAAYTLIVQLNAKLYLCFFMLCVKRILLIILTLQGSLLCGITQSVKSS